VTDDFYTNEDTSQPQRLPDDVRRERAMAVASDILEMSERFNMNTYFSTGKRPDFILEDGRPPVSSLSLKDFRHTCGTTMCIAGFAATRACPEATIKLAGFVNFPHDELTDDVARKWLGLSKKEAMELFFAYDLRAEDAAEVLDDYAEKGVLNIDLIYRREREERERNPREDED